MFADMEFHDPKELLKKHALRVTECRLDVLSFFSIHSRALSFRDLENEFEKYDRVTLYRTLNSFEESGLVHKIPTDSGAAAFGLCHNDCDVHNHNHNHIHFTCDECGTVECIDTHKVPDVQLSGYEIKEVNFLVNGICKTCKVK